MAALPITEINTNANMEVFHPCIEVIEFRTQSKADYYDTKKLRQIDAGFATTQTTDNDSIQVSSTNQSNGQPRITLNIKATDVITGWLVLIGGM